LNKLSSLCILVKQAFVFKSYFGEKSAFLVEILLGCMQQASIGNALNLAFLLNKKNFLI